MKAKSLIVFVTLALVGVVQAGISWTETFDTGVGRFDQYEANGDTAFTWNSSTQTLDATFVRWIPADKRYAPIPMVDDISAGYYGFSTLVSISGQIPGRESDNATAHFGFMNSAGADVDGFCLVGAEITRPSEGIMQFVLRAGEGTWPTGAYVRSQGAIPFVLNQTYFIDAHVNGPEHAFTTDFFLGLSRDGDYLGSLSVDLTSMSGLGFDALGFVGDGDTQRTVIQANFDNFSFSAQPVPLPGSVLLGVWGVGLAGWRMRRERP